MSRVFILSFAAALCAIAAIPVSLFYAFGWAFAPQVTYAVLLSVLLSLLSLGLLGLSIWKAVTTYRRGKASLSVFVVPLFAILFVGGPVFLNAVFLYPRDPSPSYQELRQSWTTHASQLQAINETMVELLNDHDYPVLVLESYEGSVLEGRRSFWQFEGRKLGNDKQTNKLRSQMDAAGIERASISRDGSWYRVFSPEEPFVYRGYFFYGDGLSANAGDETAESKLKTTRWVASYRELSNDWYLYTETRGR